MCLEPNEQGDRVGSDEAEDIIKGRIFTTIRIYTLKITPSLKRIILNSFFYNTRRNQGRKHLIKKYFAFLRYFLQYWRNRGRKHWMKKYFAFRRMKDRERWEREGPLLWSFQLLSLSIQNLSSLESSLYTNSCFFRRNPPPNSHPGSRLPKDGHSLDCLLGTPFLSTQLPQSCPVLMSFHEL